MLALSNTTNTCTHVWVSDTNSNAVDEIINALTRLLMLVT